jgi:hypothetical protein
MELAMSDASKKNDGTDPTKAEQGSDSNSKATDRTCYMNVVNKTSSTMTAIAMTHSSGPNNEVLNVPTLLANASSMQKQISFETGWWADFDYWNIALTYKGSVYTTPNNDRCNISFEDAGQLVQCEVTDKGNGDLNLYVNTPKSSGCNFVVTKQ